MGRKFILAALLCGTVFTPAVAGEVPIAHVTLFEAGLAEIERSAGVVETFELRVPLKDVNDILKSLVIRGEGITGAVLRLDGMSPVEDAFSGLPVAPGAVGNLQSLLSSISGTRVSINDGETGMVMGVSAGACEEAPCPALLSLMLDDETLVQRPIGDRMTVRILDEALRTGLERGVKSMISQNSGSRIVDVTLTGGGEASVSYVIETPSWKTAYRAINRADGSVDLQAWAVIENATGEDWNDVGLTLSSGAPRTIKSDLSARSWPNREQYIAEKSAQSLDPNMGFRVMADMESNVAEMAMAAPQAMSSLSAGAVLSDTTADSRFTFPDEVDIASGKIVSLPFLSGKITASHKSVWNGSRTTAAGAPDLVLEIENNLPVRLPSGIMTVQDAASGYVGDASFPLLVPGQSETVTFGKDQKVKVEEMASQISDQRALTASKGLIRTSENLVMTTTYKISSPSGEERSLVILHPLDEAWKPEVLGTDGALEREILADGRQVLRIGAEIKPSQSTDIAVRETRTVKETIRISDLNPDQMIQWSGDRMSEDDRAYLERAASLMAEISSLEAELADKDRERQMLVSEQSRSGTMLERLERGSAPHDRFMQQVLDLEDAITSATVDLRDLEERLRAEREALNFHIRG